VGYDLPSDAAMDEFMAQAQPRIPEWANPERSDFHVEGQLSTAPSTPSLCRLLRS
jgi:hypothetical protein